MIHNLRRGFSDLIDILLPRLCCGCAGRVIEPGEIVCRSCLLRVPALFEPICVLCGCPDARITEVGRCKACPPGKAWFQKARACTIFAGMVQEIVHRLKYHRRPEYAKIMVEAMLALRSTEAKTLFAADLVVPVPLHPVRRRERGFNQTEAIAELLAKKAAIPYTSRALVRIRPTTSQIRLKKRARRKNVENAFKCARPDLVYGRRILLVDDVFTTGSTVNECARMLILAGAESVECIAYARATLE